MVAVFGRNTKKRLQEIGAFFNAFANLHKVLFIY